MTTGPPRILTSPFCDEGVDPKSLTVVLLNWTLPEHTLPLWESGMTSGWLGFWCHGECRRPGCICDALG